MLVSGSDTAVYGDFDIFSSQHVCRGDTILRPLGVPFGGMSQIASGVEFYF
jgi:hypothetical protein